MHDGMANSVDPDQTAPLGAVWSGSALFAQAYLSENLGSLRYIGNIRNNIINIGSPAIIAVIIRKFEHGGLSIQHCLRKMYM